MKLPCSLCLSFYSGIINVKNAYCVTNDGMFVYPDHLKTVIWEHHAHEETKKNFEGGFSYQSRGLLMSDHGPTHVDALSHLDPNPEEPTKDKMSLDLFYGPASCLFKRSFRK